MQFKSDSPNLLESVLARSNSTLYLRCDQSGQVVVCSPAMGAFLQVNAEKVLGENVFGLLREDENERIGKALERPEWESTICQFSLSRKEGLIFQLSADSEGFVLLGEHPDLQAIEAAYKRRQLEDSENLKSAFLANLNHEIRDPLNAVSGMAHLLDGTPLNEQQFQYLKNIQGGIENLLEVLDRVLEFSAAEGLEPRLRPRQYNLDSLLQGLSRQLGGRARAKEVEILIQTDPDVPGQLQGDPVVLHQLLAGLLDNSLKFSAGGRVSLSVQRLEAGGLQFKVLDSGIGMSAEQLRELNDPFSQSDHLGLGRCRRWAELLGAELKLESQPGQGTLVTLKLPLEQGPAPVPAPRRPGGPGQKVLVVEDDPLNQRIVRELLEQAGVEVDVAGNGRQALDMLQRGEWRMVLMDLEMPQLDGIETTRRIRQQASFDPIPIVATTSHVLPEQRQRCQEVGMDGFLSKPIDPNVWFERLAEWLPLRAASQQQAFPELSAVNTRSGLQHCGGNPSFYRSLLQGFGERCQGALRELELAQRHAELEVIQSACHSLYGVAANLGAEELAEACLQTEKLARSQSEQQALASLPTVLEALRVTAACLAQELGPAPRPQAVAEGWTAENLARARAVLEKLSRQLRAGQADALDSVQELLACSPTLDRLSQLERLVNQFDFSAALAEIEDLQLG